MVWGGFFFSSRRRHTRLQGDWSSDVCSSDLQECISINQSHLNGLLLYGVVCAIEERIDAAETFFEAATNVAPTSVVAWTMLSLFYDGIENDIGR